MLARLKSPCSSICVWTEIIELHSLLFSDNTGGLNKSIKTKRLAYSTNNNGNDECQLKVGNWFLRPNKKVFFTPEKQALEDM
jgi:hypothetical protein